MLKIFRRIRQKLIDEGNPKKYLIYALGEIFLVVIGILLALQINTWNSNNNDRKSERDYLSQLRSELKEDIENLETEKKKLQAQLPAINDLLIVLNQEKIDSSTFNKSVTGYINACWYSMAFSSNSATFEELKSSGKLGLIKDKLLRNQIVGIYNDLNNLENVFTEVNEFGRSQVIDLALFKGFAKFMDDQKNTFSKYNTPEELYEMRKYKGELINQAANENWDIEDVLPLIDLQLKELELLTTHIENCLNQ